MYIARKLKPALTRVNTQLLEGLHYWCSLADVASTDSYLIHGGRSEDTRSTGNLMMLA